MCGRSFGYYWEEDEWILEREWWFLPGQYDFLCSKACWRKAEKESYYEPKTHKESVQTGIPIHSRPEDLSELPTVSIRMQPHPLDQEGKS